MADCGLFVWRFFASGFNNTGPEGPVVCQEAQLGHKGSIYAHIVAAGALTKTVAVCLSGFWTSCLCGFSLVCCLFLLFIL